MMATDENKDPQESGKILLQINNGDENVNEWSKEEKIGGFKWRLRGRKTNSPADGWMDILIACNLDSCLNKLWMAKVEIMIEYPQRQIIANANAYFFSGFEMIYKIEPPTNEAFFDLVFYLKVLRSSSNNGMMALDTELRFIFPKYDAEEDEVMEVERVVPVNKFGPHFSTFAQNFVQALAAISKYFRKLFFEYSASADSTSFTINEEVGFNARAFKMVVYSALAMGWMVHETKILYDKLALLFLNISVKYDIPMMQNYCEQYLLQSENCLKMELLETAEQLGLQKLKEHALSTISPLDVSEDLERIVDIRSRLSEPTRRQLDKRLADKTEELRNELAKKRKIDEN